MILYGNNGHVYGKVGTSIRFGVNSSPTPPSPTGDDTVTLAGRIWKTNNVTGEFGTMYSDCTSGTTTAAEGPQWFYQAGCCDLINQAYSAEGWRVPTSADWDALFSEYGTPEALHEAGFNNAKIGYYMYDDDPHDPEIIDYDYEMFGCSTTVAENYPTYAMVDYENQENKYIPSQWGFDYYSVRLVKDIQGNNQNDELEDPGSEVGEPELG